MKKKKILLIILAIIVAIIIIYSIYVIRNLNMINQIISKEQSYNETNNFYYKTLTDDKNINDNTTIIDHYKKDNITKVIAQNAENQILQWSDSNEAIYVYPSTLKYKNTQVDSVLSFNFPYVLKNLEDKEKLLIACISKIRKEDVDGEKCYVIEFSGTKYYVNLETGLLAKTVSKRNTSEGEKQEFTVVYKEWKIDTVTDEEIAKPDITNYTQIEN